MIKTLVRINTANWLVIFGSVHDIRHYPGAIGLFNKIGSVIDAHCYVIVADACHIYVQLVEYIYHVLSFRMCTHFYKNQGD